MVSKRTKLHTKKLSEDTTRGRFHLVDLRKIYLFMFNISAGSRVSFESQFMLVLKVIVILSNRECL